MEYRTHRGVEISEVGVGAYALSGAYGPKDPQAFAAMLMRAVELGVNFFVLAGAARPLATAALALAALGLALAAEAIRRVQFYQLQET